LKYLYLELLAVLSRIAFIVDQEGEFSFDCQSEKLLLCKASDWRRNIAKERFAKCLTGIFRRVCGGRDTCEVCWALVCVTW